MSVASLASAIEPSAHYNDRDRPATYLSTPAYQLAMGGCDYKRSWLTIFGAGNGFRTHIICAIIFWRDIQSVVILRISPMVEITAVASVSLIQYKEHTGHRDL